MGRALEVDPRHVAALSNYGYFLETIRQDYDRAEEMYERALEVDPRHVSALSNYGDFLQTIRQDYGRAEEMYERALEVDPRHVTALSNYACLLLEDRKPCRILHAEELAEKILNQMPGHENAQSMLKIVENYKEKNPEKIRLHLKRVQKESKTDPSVRMAAITITKEAEEKAEQAMRELLLEEENKGETKMGSAGG